MSSLDYTYENLDNVVPRANFLSPTIDPKKTMLLVLDMQKACAEVGGACTSKASAAPPKARMSSSRSRTSSPLAAPRTSRWSGRCGACAPTAPTRDSPTSSGASPAS